MRIFTGSFLLIAASFTVVACASSPEGSDPTGETTSALTAAGGYCSTDANCKSSLVCDLHCPSIPGREHCEIAGGTCSARAELTTRELVGTSFKDYFVEPERAAAGVQQTLRQGFVRDYELMLRSRHRRQILVSFNASIAAANAALTSSVAIVSIFSRKGCDRIMKFAFERVFNLRVPRQGPVRLRPEIFD